MPPEFSDDSTAKNPAFSGLSGLRLIVAVTLIMAAGWGIRGAFGHSRGAAMPGAMLGLSLCLLSLRSDWWRRIAVIGFLTAVGWAFAGTASYGLLIGYSQGGSWINSAYGYSGLFLVGSLYGGIGAAMLAMGLTEKRSFLDQFLWPMILIYSTWLLLDWTGATAWSLQVFAKVPDRPLETLWLYDTLWLDAAVALVFGIIIWIMMPRWKGAASLIVLLSASWFFGMFLLVRLTGFRINPSRGDAWAGCLGMLIALVRWNFSRTNRAAVMLISFGALAGGLGFVVGELIQALGRARWGPIGQFESLQEFGYWTVMEQTLGGFMGLGVSLAALKLIHGGLQEVEEDSPSSWFSSFAVFVLLGLLFTFNFPTNFRHWSEMKLISDQTLGLPVGQVLSVVACLILGLLAFALWRQRRGYLNLVPQSLYGRGLLLTLVFLWMDLAVYMMLPRVGLPTSLMFFLALIIGTFLLLTVTDPGPKAESDSGTKNQTPASSDLWMLSVVHLLAWVCVPVVVATVAWLTMTVKLPVKQDRFGQQASLSASLLP
ncbi:MAG: hypothetical protein ACK526_00800 [Planctomyces sp.]